LEDKFRVVLVLVDISGEDYESVAVTIDRPIGTVKSRLARARQKVQECLQGYGELLPEKFRLNDKELR
jgi:RNA polymerase sigma-70 factor (ECF subfamily)